MLSHFQAARELCFVLRQTVKSENGPFPYKQGTLYSLDPSRAVCPSDLRRQTEKPHLSVVHLWAWRGLADAGLRTRGLGRPGRGRESLRGLTLGLASQSWPEMENLKV